MKPWHLKTLVALLAAGVLLSTGYLLGQDRVTLPGDPGHQRVNGQQSTTVAAAYKDSPVQLSLPGTTATLTHQTGLRFEVSLNEGIGLPPVLWDGDWVVETDSGYRETIRVGAVNPDGDLHACIRADTGEQGEGIRCAQGVMTGIALTAGYTAGEKEFLEAAAASNGDIRWGRYCHLSAMTAAAAAVLGGEEPRTIMDGHAKLCEFSTYQGAAAGATIRDHGDLASILAFCEPDPNDEEVPFSQGTQCWHGVGFGLAYLHRFDPEPGVAVCANAPDSSWEANCIDGMFSAYRHYLRRAEDGQWQTGKTGTAERCHELHLRLRHPQFADTCYKDIAQRFTLQHSNSVPEQFIENLGTAITALASQCSRAVDEAELRACWQAVAFHVSVGVLSSYDEQREIARGWVSICEEAGEMTGACYIRMSIAMHRDPQRPFGISRDEILAMIPVEHHYEVNRELDAWLIRNYGQIPETAAASEMPDATGQ